MDGQFIVVVDDHYTVGGTFADDVSAGEYMRELQKLCQYNSYQVKALCTVCAMHVEREDGQCPNGPLPDPTSYDTNIATLNRVLEGLQAL